MIVKIDITFEKDIDKIKDKILLKKIADCIEHIQNSESVKFIKNLKKLKISKNIYRIKIGDYRLGIIVEKDTIEFVRCLHRKEIYRYFPK